MNTIILTSSSGAGKTSLAQALQEELLPSVWLHFSLDTIIYSLPKSVLERCNKQNDWSGVDAGALYAGALSCLTSLIHSGNNIIFDMVLTNENQASQLQLALSGTDYHSFHLHSDWETIKDRTIKRADRTLEEAKQLYDYETQG